MSVLTVNALVYGQYEVSFKLILIKRRHSSLLRHHIDTLLILLRIRILTYNFAAHPVFAASNHPVLLPNLRNNL